MLNKCLHFQGFWFVPLMIKSCACEIVVEAGAFGSAGIWLMKSEVWSSNPVNGKILFIVNSIEKMKTNKKRLEMAQFLLLKTKKVLSL